MIGDGIYLNKEFPIYEYTNAVNGIPMKKVHH